MDLAGRGAASPAPMSVAERFILGRVRSPATRAPSQGTLGGDDEPRNRLTRGGRPHGRPAAGARPFRHAKIETTSTHGTGCTLSAAVAAGLARGASLDQATAAALELGDRDTVWVVSPRARYRARLHVYPGTAPGHVNAPYGMRHPGGESADPLTLLDGARDALTGLSS